MLPLGTLCGYLHHSQRSTSCNMAWLVGHGSMPMGWPSGEHQGISRLSGRMLFGDISVNEKPQSFQAQVEATVLLVNC